MMIMHIRALHNHYYLVFVSSLPSDDATAVAVVCARGVSNQEDGMIHHIIMLSIPSLM